MKMIIKAGLKRKIQTFRRGKRKAKIKIIDKTNADKGLYIYVPKKDSKNSEIKLYYLKEQNRFHIHVQVNVTN